MPLAYLVSPRSEPIASAITFSPFNGPGWAGGSASRLAAAQVALASFLGAGQGEDGPIGTGDGAQVTANAHVVEHQLGTGGGLDGDGVDRTSRHAPSLITLKTSVRRVTGLFIEDIDPDHRARRLKTTGLHPGACQFALHATGTLVGNNLQSLAHELLCYIT